MSRASRKTIPKLIVKGAISVLLLFAIFSFVPIREVLNELRDINPAYAVAGLLISPVMALLRAIQIRILAIWQGLSLTAGQIFRIGYITQFYGLFLPGILAGGAIRWYKFTRHDGKPVEALAIITLGRIVALLVSVLLGLGCWLADPVARRYTGFGIGLVGMLLALITLWLLWWHHQSAVQLLARITPRQRIPESLRVRARRVLNAVPDLRSIGLQRILRIAAISGLENLLGILSFWLFAEAFGFHINVAGLAWIRTYIMLILMLPVSVGGFGVREGGLIVTLAAYGVSAELAVAYSLLLFARRLLSAMAGGVFELWAVVWSSRSVTGNQA